MLRILQSNTCLLHVCKRQISSSRLQSSADIEPINMTTWSNTLWDYI
jgi:hypothetical protein